MSEQAKHIKALFQSFGGKDIPTDDEITALLTNGTLPPEKYSVQAAIALVKDKKLLQADIDAAAAAATRGAYITAAKKMHKFFGVPDKFDEATPFDDVLDTVKKHSTAPPDANAKPAADIEQKLSKLQAEAESLKKERDTLSSEYTQFKGKIEKDKFDAKISEYTKKVLSTKSLPANLQNEDFYEFLYNKATKGKEVKLQENGTVDIYSGTVYSGGLQAELEEAVKGYIVDKNPETKVVVNPAANGKATRTIADEITAALSAK